MIPPGLLQAPLTITREIQDYLKAIRDAKVAIDRAHEALEHQFLNSVWQRSRPMIIKIRDQNAHAREITLLGLLWYIRFFAWKRNWKNLASYMKRKKM